FKEFAATASCQGGETDRGEWGSEGRRPNFRQIFYTQDVGHDTDGWDTGGFPLVSARGDRGVAFDVFHRGHAGTGGTQDVGDRLVALQVNEVVVVMLGGFARWGGYQPYWLDRPVWAPNGAGGLCLGLVSSSGGCCGTGCGTGGQGRGGAVFAA